MVHPEVVEKYLEGKCHMGQLIGPFAQMDLPGMHHSPFGVIPKKGQNTWRLILNLSSPKGKSVNDSIDEELASISYVIEKVL